MMFITDLTFLIEKYDLQNKGLGISLFAKNGETWLVLNLDDVAIDDFKLIKETTINKVEAWLEDVLADLDAEDEAEAEHINDLMGGDKYV